MYFGKFVSFKILLDKFHELLHPKSPCRCKMKTSIVSNMKSIGFTPNTSSLEERQGSHHQSLIYLVNIIYISDMFITVKDSSVRSVAQFYRRRAISNNMKTAIQQTQACLAICMFAAGRDANSKANWYTHRCHNNDDTKQMKIVSKSLRHKYGPQEALKRQEEEWIY